MKELILFLAQRKNTAINTAKSICYNKVFSVRISL